MWCRSLTRCPAAARPCSTDGITRTETVTPGHVGLIYQATNGYACGRSTARSLTYLPRHGIVVPDRTLSKIRAGESGHEGAERHLVTLGAARTQGRPTAPPVAR